MAHLAAGPGLALAVEVEAGARLGQDLGPAAGGVAQEVLHHGPGEAGRGRPAAGRRRRAPAARTGSSAQASIVQWPELCGRGASSLTSRRPSRARNISTPSRPTRSSSRRDPLRQPHRLGRERRLEGRRREVAARMWCSCRFSTGGKLALRAVGAARRDDRAARARSRRRPPGSAAARPGARQASAGVGVAVERGAGPCRRSRSGVVLRTRGARGRASRARGRRRLSIRA